jgi:hypothetical protein
MNQPKTTGQTTRTIVLANKGINVEQAIADFDVARKSNSMSAEATKTRSLLLGHHKRAKEMYGESIVGAPLLFAMIDSGDYPVQEYRGVVDIGDFSDPRDAVVQGGQSGEESSDGSESESEESERSDSDNESESEHIDHSASDNETTSENGWWSDSDSESNKSDGGSDSGEGCGDSTVSRSHNGSRDAKRTRANSVIDVDDENETTAEDADTKRARNS